MTTFQEVHQRNPFLHLLDVADTLESFTPERYYLVKDVFAWTYCTEVIESKRHKDTHPIHHLHQTESAIMRRNEIVQRLSEYSNDHTN